MLAVVILAAGQGKRMHSSLPKVLHPIGGKAMLGHVLDTATSLDPHRRIVVYGHGGEQVQAAFSHDASLSWVEQAQQLGTGHAVAQALPLLQGSQTTLVLYGDVPLLPAHLLEPLIASAQADHLALLTVQLDDPRGYGRIVRDPSGRVQQIVEQKDATPEEQTIQECNSGILAVPTQRLEGWLQRLDNQNAQGEYYLTDIIAMAAADGVPIEASIADEAEQVLGVNNRAQQAQLERYYQRQQAEALLTAGVTLLDPARLDIRGEVTVGQDVIIDVNVILEGKVHLADGVRIGPHTVIRDTTIGPNSEILAHCHLESVQIGAQVQVGPFARLRPDTVLADRARVGNFVEIKKGQVGEGSKVNHLSYIGDAEIGKEVNVGAGTITCNYDGANKHRTVLGDGVFIGSNTALVAPIQVGNNATVGAGSTLSEDVPDGALAFTRAPCREIPNWPRPRKRKS